MIIKILNYKLLIFIIAIPVIFYAIANWEFLKYTLTYQFHETIDISKRGIVFDKNISINKTGLYEVNFIYSQELLEQIKEKEISEKTRPSRENVEEFAKWLCSSSSITKIAGLYKDDKMSDLSLNERQNTKNICSGSKIVLKISITPLHKNINQWKYFKGNDKDIYIQNARTLNDTNFHITSDLSKYGNFKISTAPNGAIANYKRIATVELNNGNFNIKIESLNYIPEVKNILTYFELEEIPKDSPISIK